MWGKASYFCDDFVWPTILLTMFQILMLRLLAARTIELVADPVKIR